MEQKYQHHLESRGAQLSGNDYVVFLRDFLGLLERKFHPNHSIVMRAKSGLISSLGNVNGHFYHQLSDEGLRYKERLCRSFIEVFSKIDPGASDWRGGTLYELANTLTTIAQRYVLGLNLVA